MRMAVQQKLKKHNSEYVQITGSSTNSYFTHCKESCWFLNDIREPVMKWVVLQDKSETTENKSCEHRKEERDEGK